jgi:hypothetical protein
VIPVAFAIIESDQPGMYYSLKLTNVVAESMEQLYPGAGNRTVGAFALQRAQRAFQEWWSKSRLETQRARNIAATQAAEKAAEEQRQAAIAAKKAGQ